LKFSDLKIAKETRKNIIAFCPYHKDSNTPNLYIIKRGAMAGFYKCFACGAKGYMDLPKKYEMKKEKRSKPVDINWFGLVLDYLSGGLNLGYPGDLFYKGSSRDFMIGWDIYTNCYTIPMRNEYREIIGIQRRFLDNSKCSVEGSKLGLFIKELGNVFSNCQQVIITEGLSDCVVATKNYGFAAIGRPSCNSCEGMVENYLNINCSNCKEVVIITDNDNPGIRGAKSLADRLKKKYQVKIIAPPIGIKDLRMWKDNGLTKEKLDKIIEKTNVWI